MARKGVLQNLEGRDTVRVLTDWAQDMQSSGRYGFVELECEPGELLAPSTPLFPVLKVLLHAERAKSTRLQNCHCLNRTFLCPGDASVELNTQFILGMSSDLAQDALGA